MGKTFADVVISLVVCGLSVFCAAVVSDRTGDTFHIQGIVLMLFFVGIGVPVFWIKNKIIDNSESTIYMTDTQKRGMGK